MLDLSITIQAASHLAALVGPDGRFLYRYDHESGADLGGYNLLRHCGCIWSMLDARAAFADPGQVVAAAERAAKWLVTRHIEPGPRNSLCAVDEGTVKLGGNALAILALVAMAEATGNRGYRDTAEGLGQYILLQRRPDGDFVHKRDYPSGKPSDFRSNYYTGEALFALVRLFGATGARYWLETAAESGRRLAARDYGVAEQSHWMLYFLEAQAQAGRDSVVAAHAGRIVRHILDHPDYRATGRSTPVACRTEGLLAFMRMGTEDAGIAPALLAECRRAIEDNLRLQATHRVASGAFRRGHGRAEVRIDYIQHNLSAFWGYWRLFGPAPAGPAPPAQG